MAAENTLVTISFSHYCEKARWALDRFAVPYREAAYMPMIHFPGVLLTLRGRRSGRADRNSTRFSTPLLVTADGELLTDSRDIVKWVDARHAHSRLHPNVESEAIERDLGERLGPHIRRVIYFHLLPQKGLLRQLADDNVGRAQATLFKVVRPLAVRGIGNFLRVTPEGAARSEKRVRDVADEIAERMADGRRYLLGDHFSAADIAFASLFGPAVLPPEYGAKLPAAEDLPPPARALTEEMRAHPAGQLALRLYREERRRVAP